MSLYTPCPRCSKKLSLPETDFLGQPLNGQDLQVEANEILDRHNLEACPRFEGYTDTQARPITRIKIFDTEDGDLSQPDDSEELYEV